ncbi:MAG: S-methyl-5'-thioinosine phosphorylase [Xanthomonadales bacterium]|nr:S-methyl-5'-thioinosine phosphorylase [Xanthomonadales bacterium]MCC6594397.1 S-methyl-5'-thioinosine phosphorylase [Xanthomonadales bacterium]MCE7932117.1 S-methyl-5'-thioinosine phosphorylase [Xanthomonadales bacterium PRO6]
MSEPTAPIGIIGGTGFGRIAELGDAQSIDVETEYGQPSCALRLGELAGTGVAFLARHGSPHRIAPHRVNYRANIAALKSVGVREILAINAVGGIAAWARAGALAIPDQLIDYTHGRLSSFSDHGERAVEHIDFSDPFDAPLRARLLTAANASGVTVHDGGCVAVTEGPRLETRAEIARLRRDGCDLVGMTSMPEAVLAREASLAYASIAVIANPAAGVAEDVIGIHEIELTLAATMQRVLQVIETFLMATCRPR